MRSPSLLATALCTCACANAEAARRLSIAPQLSARERAAAERIRAEDLSGHIRFLADDLLEGRGPGTRGSRLAIAYLASELEAAGLVGGQMGKDGKRSFLQPVPLV